MWLNPPVVLPCKPDLDGNRTVNGADLALLLQVWGTCSNCPGDLNGDGLVNGSDIAIMLQSWGSCP
jgi:hypothetical protein